jgi:glycyl-tRNA synthetase beta chain
VVAGFAKRMAEIERQLTERAQALGARLRDHEDLLEEVTALTEFPTVYVGEFEREFLQVPQECLILTMQLNQKYFPLFDAQDRLIDKFLVVSNMRLEDPSNIVLGNQRVVRPRLADARFFFEQDKKVKLAERVPQLAGIVYHNKLGSQLDRVERIRKLGVIIAERMNVDPRLVDRAAFLCKADLLTGMVGEFPELQGTMGRYYAQHDGETPEVAEAIQAHYWPRFAGDRLPPAGIATAVALADKLEALAGLFGAGQQPTGDKDPFGLRRAALGVVRIVVEGQLSLSLSDLVREAFEVFPSGMIARDHAELDDFIYDRLRSYLRDLGYSVNEVESVLALRPARLDLVPRQLAAVRVFAGLPEADSLSAANKRVANILRQAKAKGELFGEADAARLHEPAERALFDALRRASVSASAPLEDGDFTGYLKAFAVLREPVDAFFDSVMVMVEDPLLRHNRLALLRDLREQMNKVADISKLAS